MIMPSIVAALHYLTLGLGLGSVFMRGKYIRALIANSDRKENLKKLFAADSLWGLAALFWIVTGLWRVFGGLEKGEQWYFHSPMFLLKMGLFLLVFLLELFPMFTFIKWRMDSKKKTNSLDVSLLPRLRLVNDFELFIICVIPFVASFMARGVVF